MIIEFQQIRNFFIKKNRISKHFSVFLGLISGISVFYFLYFLDAYGIQKGVSYSGHSHFYRSLSFGVLTFVYLTIFETWLKPKWTTNRYIHTFLWYSGLVILGIQFIFILFNFFWNWQEWNIEAYSLIIKEFPLMMLLPLSFYLILKTKLKSVEGSYLSFQSVNGKDQLKVKIQDFLFAKSSENYITISYTSKNNSKTHLIRKPLKVLEQELKSNPEIERTHRSYLVNKNNIQSVKQIKSKVCLEINGENIPVSKKFQQQFLR
tara:strand:- start:2131 stop:2919 length:789 start_codon:yes stop_codon:yes gene_type:complete